jgi:hypothetical protein
MIGADREPSFLMPVIPDLWRSFEPGAGVGDLSKILMTAPLTNLLATTADYYYYVQEMARCNINNRRSKGKVSVYWHVFSVR